MLSDSNYDTLADAIRRAVCGTVYEGVPLDWRAAERALREDDPEDGLNPLAWMRSMLGIRQTEVGLGARPEFYMRDTGEEMTLTLTLPVASIGGGKYLVVDLVTVWARLDSGYVLRREETSTGVAYPYVVCPHCFFPFVDTGEGVYCPICGQRWREEEEEE